MTLSLVRLVVATAWQSVSAAVLPEEAAESQGEQIVWPPMLILANIPVDSDNPHGPRHDRRRELYGAGCRSHWLAAWLLPEACISILERAS